MFRRLKRCYYTEVNRIRRKFSGRAKMDHLFASGHWDSLHEIEELGHYSIITGYVRFFKSGGSILDLGCGDGLLSARFSEGDYSKYLGIDYSEVGISKAKSLEDARRKFITGDLHNVRIDGLYDVIICNESLYYLRNGADVLDRFLVNLSDDGIVIVSMLDKKDYERPLWAELERYLTLIDETKVYNRRNTSWTIKVYQK